MSVRIQETFERSVEEGEARLHRTFPSLLATGTVGGIDVGLGVLALFLVLHVTDNAVVASLAFSIGFVAVALANSELFTENFLVPVIAVASHKAKVVHLLRLWGGTLVMNLVGGWSVMGLLAMGFPELKPVALKAGDHFSALGTGWRAFSMAMLAGVIITLMTWMEHGANSLGADLAASVGAGFILALGEFNHAIVMSLEMFAALHYGAPFGYLDWASATGLAVVGNFAGGVGFVTVMRLVQVGRRRIQRERTRGRRTDEEGKAKDRDEDPGD